MTRVLLTGGSGFIASHVLDVLLSRGYSVVTTVRSQEKADLIKADHSDAVESGQLGFAIVKELAEENAFDKVVISDPPFDAVVHTASPLRFNITSIQKEIIDPAIIGTTGILKSIKKSAPSVKRVVITGSFVALHNPSKGNWPEHTYTEQDWNPITHEEALQNPMHGYQASKKYAEQAAWDFLEKEKPGFTITTLIPALVFGPISHATDSLDNLNLSNMPLLEAARGEWKDEIAPSLFYLYVDVRDLAVAHVACLEKPDADNKRIIIVGDYYANRGIANLVKKHFPELKNVPSESTPGGDYPEGGVEKGLYKCSTQRSKEILGVTYRSLEESVVDTVKSFQAKGL